MQIGEKAREYKLVIWRQMSKKLSCREYDTGEKSQSFYTKFLSEN